MDEETRADSRIDVVYVLTVIKYYMIFFSVVEIQTNSNTMKCVPKMILLFINLIIQF